jgi:hypothetical protein
MQTHQSEVRGGGGKLFYEANIDGLIVELRHDLSGLRQKLKVKASALP